MATPVVVAYDAGTSGVKALVVDAAGRVLASSIRSYGVTTPRPGWAEQDVEEIVAALGAASREALGSLGREALDVAAVAVTAQMFSVVPVDGRGRALRPMLSWLDQRAGPDAAAIEARIGGGPGRGPLDSVLTGKDIVPKIAWLVRNEPATAARAAWFVDCKEAVVGRLTGRVAIDPAGASAFRLLDPASRSWDPARCEATGIERDRLPPIAPASSVVGELTAEGAALTGLRPGTPVVTGTGDVAASQVGAGAIGHGDTHLSLGTAVYFGITSSHYVPDPRGRLGPLAHGVPGEWIVWLEIATGGAALTWLDRQVAGVDGRPGAGSHDRADVDRTVDAVVPEMDGLLFLPWLTGERVPLFDDAARAAFVGLALHHGPAHLVRAVMEGVACQIAWAFEYGLGYGVPPGSIRVVGGGSIGTAWTGIVA
ncbi:MAG TPA: FGGY family carbohydrate kinase, partial [Candidatus Limnocylindrales bacterium]|nr:FGGY family carbohydrate kinase [Candidatus Limnocylindrales bacterium]